MRVTRLSPVVLLAVVVGLAGCTATAPPPSTGANSSATTDPTNPSEVAATFNPDGTAQDNLPLFAAVVNRVWEDGAGAVGRAYIDELVAVGFDKEAMSLTEDRTTVDNPADSIQFAVEWDGECLVGQVGPSVPAPAALVMPVLDDGGCLIGETRPIDW